MNNLKKRKVLVVLVILFLKRYKSNQSYEKCVKITPEIQKYIQCRKDTKLDICIIDENMVDPCWDNPEIIIIGAGMAGLSAGQRLAASGLTKITIIEATHRAGGRIHSSKFGNVPIEIGATFIEGASLSNPVYTLASQESLITKAAGRYDPSSGLCFASDGEVIPAFVAQAARQSFQTLLDRIGDLYINPNVHSDCGGIFEVILKEMDRELDAFPFKYRDYASRVMLSEAIYLKNFIGNCLCEVSAKYFGSYAMLNGGRINIPSGMVGILAPLLRAMPNCESIRYCKPVSQIIWSAKDEYEDEEKKRKKPRAKVICCDGHILNADYVIITLPLGVLKKNLDTMFSPSLPQTKLDAINRLGYGLINHVYFEYNRPFWSWQDGRIRPCWRLDELKDNGHWTKGISSIDEVQTSQQILSVTLSHNAASCVEELSELKLAEDFTRLLRRFLDDPTIPYPVNVLKTKWAACPYSLGAKTFITNISNIADICEVGRTVPDECQSDVPVLMFAGEATTPGSNGTLHGARLSGIREAERIINYTKKFQGKPGTKYEESVCENVAITA